MPEWIWNETENGIYTSAYVDGFRKERPVTGRRTNEIHEKKRGHRADGRGVMGALECVEVSGIEMAVSCAKRREPEQSRGGKV